MELAERRGELIEVDLVARFLARHIAEHNSQADQLRDRVLQLLPPKMKAADRQRVLAGVAKAVDDLRFAMAELAEQWEREVLQDAESDDADEVGAGE